MFHRNNANHTVHRLHLIQSLFQTLIFLIYNNGHKHTHISFEDQRLIYSILTTYTDSSFKIIVMKIYQWSYFFWYWTLVKEEHTKLIKPTTRIYLHCLVWKAAGFEVLWEKLRKLYKIQNLRCDSWMKFCIHHWVAK